MSVDSSMLEVAVRDPFRKPNVYVSVREAQDLVSLPIKEPGPQIACLGISMDREKGLMALGYDCQW